MGAFMRALIQRVSEARVDVAGETVGAIDRGLLVLLGVEKGDTREQVEKLVHKVLHYRVFADEQGKMNCNVQQVGGSLLVVSQFTLAADTQKGLRPSFSSAAAPELAEALYEHFLAALLREQARVETGIFAADMQVHLVNDGPVTFLLET